MRILYLMGLAIGALMLAAAAPAFAQATDTRVDFDPLIAEIIPYVLALASAIIAAAVAWTTKKLNDWTGIQIEARHREALQSALMNGARMALARGMPQGVHIDVKSAPVRAGIDFVINSVPDAIDYFGLSPSDLERHLLPKLAAIAADGK